MKVRRACFILKDDFESFQYSENHTIFKTTLHRSDEVTKLFQADAADATLRRIQDPSKNTDFHEMNFWTRKEQTATSRFLPVKANCHKIP